MVWLVVPGHEILEVHRAGCVQVHRMCVFGSKEGAAHAMGPWTKADSCGGLFVGRALGIFFRWGFLG
jgi:hypothetical protein